MANKEITKTPIAKTGMLIRRPVEEVYEAIVDPAITTKFWFSKASGRLDEGHPVKWEWENYGVSIDVTPKVIEKAKRIAIEWPGYSGPTTVEWTFQSLTLVTTFVRVRESGWEGDADQLLRYVADSTEGFTLLMAGMKAWLEHQIELNLTFDRFPKGIEEHQHE